MNGALPGASLDQWIGMLSQAPIPVLRDSALALKSLKAREDEVTARDLSNAILRDPMLTLIVLRFLQVHRPSRRIVDITTIEHGVMMLGIGPFFREFSDLPVVEDLLDGDPSARRGLQAVIARARHAAMHASRWAELRSDVETDEVAIAALLHDFAEMLLWLFAPQAAMRLAERLRGDPGLRSVAAQQEVLGFSLEQLHQSLCHGWQLPELLLSLMDQQQAYRPRVRNVLLAVDLARHAAHGWWDAALPDDYDAIKAFLKLPEPAVMDEVFRVALLAAGAQACSDEGVAAWLPPAPMFLAAAPQDPTEDDAPAPSLMDRALALLLAKPRTGSSGDLPAGRRASLPVRSLACAQVLSLAMHAIHLGLGRRRVAFLESEAGALVARFVAGGREAEDLRGLRARIGAEYDADSVLDALRPGLGDRAVAGAMIAVLRRGPEAIGVLYADGGTGDGEEEVLPRFRSIVAALETAMP